MPILRRLVAALAALVLLTAFAACGDDDDDDGDVAAEESESDGEDGDSEEGAGGEDPMVVVCSDTGQADDGVITAEEAGEGAAQMEAVTDPPAEIADAIAGAGDYLRQLEAAGEDVDAEDLQFSEHLSAIAEWCVANMP